MAKVGLKVEPRKKPPVVAEDVEDAEADSEAEYVGETGIKTGADAVEKVGIYGEHGISVGVLLGGPTEMNDDPDEVGDGKMREGDKVGEAVSGFSP